ncbi:hypothetical protein PQO01_06600 [Lentisphaera marina]|uniref:hypothetical protein n=1 Tax=Lentisphaera marina TaxID=1111041 RepID=UPI00236644A1|nr:hypothetical protein [Lentisphaera marina]MDD7984616.1 hypothetical protein [Lentisphaera marina]
MKYFMIIIVFLTNFVIATELEFIDSNGSKVDKDLIPDLLVTEYVKDKCKLVSEGRVQRSWSSYGRCQEVWQTEDYTIVCGSLGIWKYDSSNTRKIFFEPKMRPLEIHSCQPLDDGGLLVAANKTLLELSSEGKIRKLIKIPYLRSQKRLQMKTARKLDDGGYIISGAAQNKVYILNKKGMVTRIIDLYKLLTPGKVRKIHAVKLLSNGHILMSTANSGSLIEIDQNDKIVWSLSSDDVPALGLKFVGGFEIKDNGNVIVAAYNSAYPIFEIDRDKNVIWKLRRNKDQGIDRPTSLSLIDENMSQGLVSN